MGGDEPKQFLELAGVPLLLRSIRPFASHPAVRQIVVALPAEHVDAPPAWLAALVGDRVRVVAGGAQRGLSVQHGVAALDAACDLVLIHDAARPLVSRTTIDAVIDVARRGIGAVPAVPVGDTIKRADAALRVTATVPREGLWRAQTPQGFPRGMLDDAYARAADSVASYTDEAALVEAMGAQVQVVPDDPTNIKVTTPADIEVVAALLAP